AAFEMRIYCVQGFVNAESQLNRSCLLSASDRAGETGLQAFLHARPLVREDREVRRIPRLAVHRRLERAQDAVEMRAESFDGPARAVVALVGLQSHPPAAPGLEGVLQHEQLGFG